MKAKKRLILVVVVLLLANLSCGIFTKGPDKTVESFFKAVDKGKVDEAIGYLSYETIQALGYDKWRAVLLDISREASQEGEGVKRIKMLEKNVNGDYAWVTYEIFYNDGTSEVTTFDLVKENKEWKLEINPWMK